MVEFLIPSYLADYTSPTQFISVHLQFFSRYRVFWLKSFDFFFIKNQMREFFWLLNMF